MLVDLAAALPSRVSDISFCAQRGGRFGSVAMQTCRAAMLVGLVMWLAVASACGPSKYGPSQISGGFYDQKLAEDTYRVKFSGNGYTSRSTVERYALYRCAEVALETGFSYFEVLSQETRVSETITDGRYEETTRIESNGDIATTGTYRPPETVHKYTADMTIRTHDSRGHASSEDAAVIEANLRPTIQFQSDYIPVALRMHGGESSGAAETAGSIPSGSPVPPSTPAPPEAPRSTFTPSVERRPLFGTEWRPADVDTPSSTEALVRYQVALHPLLKLARAQGEVWLVDVSGSFEPGLVPPGTYQVWGRLGARSDQDVHLGEVVMVAGGELKLRCYAMTRACIAE